MPGPELVPPEMVTVAELDTTDHRVVRDDVPGWVAVTDRDSPLAAAESGARGVLGRADPLGVPSTGAATNWPPSVGSLPGPAWVELAAGPFWPVGTPCRPATATTAATMAAATAAVPRPAARNRCRERGRGGFGGSATSAAADGAARVPMTSGGAWTMGGAWSVDRAWSAAWLSWAPGLG